MDDELRKDIEDVVNNCSVIDDTPSGASVSRCFYCYESPDRHDKNCTILRLQKRLENSTV